MPRIAGMARNTGAWLWKSLKAIHTLVFGLLSLGLIIALLAYLGGRGGKRR